MTQTHFSENYDPLAVEDYRKQARDFLNKAHESLADDALHQASEKGWGAVAWMAKAVAETQSWEYREHAHFGVGCRNAGDLKGMSDCLTLAPLPSNCTEAITPKGGSCPTGRLPATLTR